GGDASRGVALAARARAALARGAAGAAASRGAGREAGRRHDANERRDVPARGSTPLERVLRRRGRRRDRRQGSPDGRHDRRRADGHADRALRRADRPSGCVVHGDAAGRERVGRREEGRVSYRTITYERRGEVALLTLNRPDRLNAWTPSMASEQAAAIGAANEDQNVGAIVMTGAGRG